MTGAGQAWFLVGPTASGKTGVAHRLARARGAWILCADSMTVYRGFDIGTAKPTPAQRAEVRYFGLDLVSPDQPFSVADFQAAARDAMAESARAGRSLIVAGGSGLYVRCLLEGLRPGVPARPELRAEAERLLAAGGVAALQERVRAAAPAHYAALADPRNPRRLVRAWELAAGGQPVERTWTEPRAKVAGLRWPPAALAARIAARVETMYAQGLVAEAERLRAEYPAWSDTARQAIGYAEALTVAAGGLTVSDAIADTARRTRQLARRQMTWFRHQLNVDWVEAEGGGEDTMAAAVAARWERHGPADVQL